MQYVIATLIRFHCNLPDAIEMQLRSLERSNLRENLLTPHATPPTKKTHKKAFVSAPISKLVIQVQNLDNFTALDNASTDRILP